MAKRNLTIQLDEATIRHAKIVAAHRGLSLSGLVAQQLNELAEADQRYERARAVALGGLLPTPQAAGRLPGVGRLSRPVKTFADANVLVYAHDTDAGTRHATARALLAGLWDDRSGFLSTQVLQEFYAVVTRKFRPAMPRAKARAVVAAYGEWRTVATEPQLTISASRLEEEHTLCFWDALIVQAAIQVGAERLVSEDLQKGRRFGALMIENPFRRA